MSDYISRELALADFEQCNQKNSTWTPQRVKTLLMRIPCADVEPVRYGRWEECDWVDVDEHGFGTRRTFKAGLRCSQCACVFKKKLLWKRNYCPSCGAKMDLEE